MKRLLFLLPLALAACDPTTPPSTVGSTPVISTVCQQISVERLDVALKAYDAAIDAVNLLIDAKVIKPGSPTALKIASANDKVLAAFNAAEAARTACNATSYAASLNAVLAGIADLRSAIHGG
jgi:hypothetical protein